VAVANDPMALRYASDELRDDKEVVLAAIRRAAPKHRGEVFVLASERLRQDVDLVVESIS